MANTVIALKKSATPTSVPADLANGELALNFADGKLFYKAANGTIASISGALPDAFSSVNADGTFLVPSSPSDVLTLIAGSNINIVGDALTDEITISATAGGGASVVISDTAPSSPTNGDLWWNSSLGKMFIYYDDSSSTQWVETVPNYIYTSSDPVTIFAIEHANQAFAQANTAKSTADLSFGHANLAFNHANAAFTNANTVMVSAQSAFTLANQAFAKANTANITADLAFDKANAALSNTSGILFGGNLNVSGNLTANVLASSNGYIDLGPGNRPPWAEGRVYYDNVDKTLTVYNNEANFILPLGQKEFVKVLNDTAAILERGKPVYATGFHLSSHHHITVDLADASDPNKYDVIGLVAANIAVGDHGYVITRGWIGGINTSGLTQGQRFHLGYSAPGTLLTTSPEYPNYPYDIGYCIVSDATNGYLYIDRQSHTFEGLRVLASARVGGDMFIEGDLTVLGSSTQVGVDSLSVGTQFVYLGAGDSIANAYFVGTGLNDMSFKGHYEDTGTKNYYVKITGTNPDKFSWSYLSDFSVLQASNVTIAFQTAQPLANGISIYFNANTGHTFDDKWNGSATGVSTDFGFVGSHVEGPNGYTHAGIFRDATDGSFVFFNSHDPEVETVVDLNDPSFEYGNVVVRRITAEQVYEGATRLTDSITIASDAALFSAPHANQAFAKANTANITADNAFTHSNNAYAKANTANITADLAFNHANSAYAKANNMNVRSSTPLSIYVGTTPPSGNNVGDLWIDTN